MSSLKLKYVKTKLHLEHYKDLYIFGGACFAAGAITVVAFRNPPKEISDAAAKKLLYMCEYIEKGHAVGDSIELAGAYTDGAHDVAISFHNLIDSIRK